MTTKQENVMTARDALLPWLSQHQLSVAKFGRQLGYLSSYPHMLLAKTNSRPLTFDFIGRIVVTFGDDAPIADLVDLMRSECMKKKGEK